jgi:hypothetical protein
MIIDDQGFIRMEPAPALTQPLEFHSRLSRWGILGLVIFKYAIAEGKKQVLRCAQDDKSRWE